MSRGVNKVILVGNLGRDPEVRYTQSNKALAKLSVATSDRRRDKQTGETVERTEWHRVVCFDKLAEIVNQYVKKGNKVFVEGMLRTQKWQDANGADRYTTEIIANELVMLDSRGGPMDTSSMGAGAPMSAPTDMPPSPPAPTAAQPQPQVAATASASSDSLDDDIPF